MIHGCFYSSLIIGALLASMWANKCIVKRKSWVTGNSINEVYHNREMNILGRSDIRLVKHMKELK
jgi:hypothetical protein